MRASRAWSAVVTRVASTFAQDGHFGIVEGQRSEISGEAVLCRLHQRAMEGSAHRQHDSALGAALLGQIGGALDCSLAAGDDGLIGRVEIGRAADFALSCFLADLLHLVDRESQDGGHGANADRNGLLHVLAAIADGADRVGEGKVPAATWAEYSPKLCPAT